MNAQRPIDPVILFVFAFWVYSTLFLKGGLLVVAN